MRADAVLRVFGEEQFVVAEDATRHFSKRREKAQEKKEMEEALVPDLIDDVLFE